MTIAEFKRFVEKLRDLGFKISDFKKKPHGEKKEKA